jgi:CHAT domain-containing protein
LEPVLEILVEVPCKLHLKIFPRLHMNAVPFHALRIRGKRLMEYGHIQVSYGQTLGLFLQAHRRQARHGKVPLRMVLSENLPQSYKGVLDTLKLVYGEKYFYGMHLTRGEFLTLAADELAGDLFFACHGHYYPDNPAASCLAFGGDKNGVRFSDIFSNLALKGCRSVTMGACESGLIRAELTAEYIGLPGAFLTHGIQYVVGSLWPVSEMSTAVLMLRYFELLCSGSYTVPAALNNAQRELMSMTREQALAWIEKHLPQYAPVLQYFKEKLGPQPYAHPYYWAGFYAAGDV